MHPLLLQIICIVMLTLGIAFRQADIAICFGIATVLWTLAVWDIYLTNDNEDDDEDEPLAEDDPLAEESTERLYCVRCGYPATHCTIDGLDSKLICLNYPKCGDNHE